MIAVSIIYLKVIGWKNRVFTITQVIEDDRVRMVSWEAVKSDSFLSMF